MDWVGLECLEKKGARVLAGACSHWLGFIPNMSSRDDKVEQVVWYVNEIYDCADVIVSQSITISKLQSATEAVERGMGMLTKKIQSQSEIIARLERERDSALKKLQALENSRPEGGLLEEMSRKLDELWEESKKRRT
jgi:hypothetical protein